MLADYNGQAVCVFSVCMTSHTTALYKSVFRELQRLFPAFQPTELMADYEAALRRAIRNTMPLVRLLGCRFHYAQSVYRKLKGKFRLSTIYQNPTTAVHKKIGSLLRQYLSLPLLQALHIRGEMNRLETQMRDCASNVPRAVAQRLNAFHTYMVSYWMRFQGFNTISVYNATHKTNNTIER